MPTTVGSYSDVQGVTLPLASKTTTMPAVNWGANVGSSTQTDLPPRNSSPETVTFPEKNPASAVGLPAKPAIAGPVPPCPATAGPAPWLYPATPASSPSGDEDSPRTPSPRRLSPW